MHIWGHFKTITRHRHQVIKHCKKAGILWQGLFHDLSKYSPTEFIPVLEQSMDICKLDFYVLDQVCRHIRRWLDEGKDLYAMLPYLRAYMGHEKFEDTAYYIHILPDRLLKSPGVDWESIDKIGLEVDLWKN